MKLKENLMRAIFRHFDGYGADGIIEIAKDIFERMENYTEENLFQAIDDGLIYAQDQWCIMEYYQSPQEANFESAMELFISDLIAIMEAVK